MNQNVNILIQLLLELRVKHIFIGKIILIRIHLYFRIYADFQADNEIDKSKITKKKQLIYINKIQCLMVIT